jgi:hypothetical protein
VRVAVTNEGEIIVSEGISVDLQALQVAASTSFAYCIFTTGKVYISSTMLRLPRSTSDIIVRIPTSTSSQIDSSEAGVDVWHM